jgi:hypothetical protein
VILQYPHFDDEEQVLNNCRNVSLFQFSGQLLVQ